MALSEFIKKHIIEANRASSAGLGDRSTYIGASDISGCLLKAYFSKTATATNSSLTELNFIRGHITENIVLEAFKASNINFEYQVELKKGYIKVHLDFLVKRKKELIVIEVKSTKSIPQTPYSSWILQLQLQMYLVKEKYPNSKIRGYVLCVDITDNQIVEFPIEFNQELAELALQRAEVLWSALQEGIEPEAEEQLYCSSCPHKAQCPLFQSEHIAPDLEEIIEEIKFLEEQQKSIKKEIETKKEEVSEYLQSKNLSKVKVGNFLVSLQKGSQYQTIDTNSLKKNSPDLWEKLLQKYGKTISRKPSLKIK